MIKLSEFLEEQTEEAIFEKLIRKKVIRNGKLKKIKRTDREGFTSRGGKEKKMKAKERVTRSKSQRLAAIKRKSKKTVANTKRKKSNKIRKSMGLDKK